MSNWISIESAPLTLAQQQHNAEIIHDMLRPEGWTLHAVCAMLGNMQLESSINPGRWENDTIGSGGFGLVQWTPASKVRNWIFNTYGSTDYTNGDYQISRIQYELQNGIQWASTSAYPMTFLEFTQSRSDVEYLALAWAYNYERGTPAEEYRKANARYWFDYFGGTSSLPIWLLFKLKERYYNV